MEKVRGLARSIRRLAVEQIRAGATGPRVLAISVPKAGTNLLTRCLSLFPGIIYSGVAMVYPGDITTRRIERGELEEKLRHIGGGCFVTTHLPFTPEAAELVADLGFVTTLIMRDPRDVAVSHFHFVCKRKQNRLHTYFSKLPDDFTRLMASIRGVDSTLKDAGGGLDDIGQRFRNHLPWADHGSCFVRFEHLIGPHGGGSHELQIQEIQRLAAHLEIDLGSEDIERIADRVFSRRSSTFRKGLIGDWKNYFTSEHKAVFKELAGQLLIDLGYEDNLDW